MLDRDPYNIALVVIGAGLLLSVWLPQVVYRKATTLAVVPLAIGAGLFYFTPGLSAPDPLVEDGRWFWEKITEALVVISLVGAGLRISRRGRRPWHAITLLLCVAMPATFLAVAGLGYWAGLGLAGALLLGACVSPTDPVLAGEVQTKEPDEEESDLRFALTGEAGLNDGLAFPLVYLAIAVALAGGQVDGALLGKWLAWDVLYRCLIAAAGGFGVGWVLGKVFYRRPGGQRLASSGCGSLMLCLYFLAYGLTEVFHGYGFIAAFLAAMAVRRACYDHDYNTELSTFAHNLEHAALAVMLVLLGGLVPELLPHLTWPLALVGLALLLVIRPVAGWLALSRHHFHARHRLAIAVFGVRGIGTIYYLAYAFGKAEFDHAEAIWAAGLFLVIVSATLHGLSAVPAMRWTHRDETGEAG
jgi:NhaP-type Na+/H+ or K+/H+ antiporter